MRTFRQRAIANLIAKHLAGHEGIDTLCEALPNDLFYPGEASSLIEDLFEKDDVDAQGAPECEISDEDAARLGRMTYRCVVEFARRCVTDTQIDDLEANLKADAREAA